MLTQITSLLLGAAASIITWTFLARVWMQQSRASFHNPVGHFIMAFTDWAARPLRRYIPGLFGVDLASLLVAWLAQLVYALAMAALLYAPATPPLPPLLAIAVFAVLRMFVYLLTFIVIVAAVLSWVNPLSPHAALFDALARPLLRPLRRWLPTPGGIDLSPLFVLLALNVALIIIDGFARSLGGGVLRMLSS